MGVLQEDRDEPRKGKDEPAFHSQGLNSDIGRSIWVCEVAFEGGRAAEVVSLALQPKWDSAIPTRATNKSEKVGF
jgi:hypothetical protein